MANPFVFNVVHVLRGDGAPVTVSQTGPSPSRIGPEMIALPLGSEVKVEATMTSLGSGILVDATATGRLEGQCVRCLAPLNPQFEMSVSQIFSASDDFIAGADEDEADLGSGDEIVAVKNDMVDLEQAFVDEMGLTLPFNPTCEPECEETTGVPAPDGVSGEANSLADPRWAGLEKFL